jgi:single-strand DNA-binding protein
VVLQRFRGELVLLGGRDEAPGLTGGTPSPDERDGDWGRSPGEPGRGTGGGRPGKSGDFDDLDDEIPF